MSTVTEHAASSRRSSSRPRVVDADADARFRDLSRRLALDPEARFVGGYVDWEWAHARHVFDGLVAPVRGRAVLELGCNLGATAVVLAALGAEVTAVDPNATYLDLARDNAARHGVGQGIAFHHVADTTRLPFEGESFDWVSCNSVLEYVAPHTLPGVLREIDRVLRPGGVAAILGTSNRLWPRENHSGRWLVNYLPRWVDRLPGGRRRSRGVGVWQIRRVLHDYDDLTRAEGGRLYVKIKERMGVSGRKLLALAAVSRVLGALGISPGALAPTMSLLLRKR
jgi:ubiquinone/menaquinone biosynthesis C-methylase UbiE